MTNPDLTTLARRALEVAEKLSPLLQGTPAGAVVAVGRSVLDLIGEVQAVVPSEDAAALKARREELEPLVLAHLGRTIDSLG